MINLALHAARPVPRYTSYPTAPHFSGDVNAADAAGWMLTLPDDARVSLYLHVPFCRDLCLYCGCNTKATRRDEPLNAYVETLRAEIALVRRSIGRRLTVAAIHWGGGTPSLLPAGAFETLLEDLGQAFAIDPDAEHAIELDPRYVDTLLVRRLAALGINRASLGVQDIDPRVQAAIGRIQPAESVTLAVEALRGAGIRSINLDLIFGLPHQTVEGIRRTAAAAAGWRPDRLAVFGYAHVPWMKPHQGVIDAATLPGAAERLGLEAAMRETLIDHGYVPVGLDHFARAGDALARAAASGHLHRNFQGYTTDDAEALIGLGASSIGKLPQGYLQNETAVAAWRRAVEEGRLPIARGHRMTADDRLRAAVIERLMCDLSVDLAAVAADFGAPVEVFADDLDAVRLLAEDGLAVVEGWRVRVPEEHRTLVRLAAAAFDAYLDRGRGRHSMAV